VSPEGARAGPVGHFSLSRAFLREYLDGVAVAPFPRVTADLPTTMFWAATLGADAEASPLVRRVPPSLVVVNVFVVVLAAVFFCGLRGMLHRTVDRYRRPFSPVVETWLGLLVAVGWGVLANDFRAVVPGVTFVPDAPGGRGRGRILAGGLSTLERLVCHGVPDGSVDHLG
jgi:hypothetical protein